jgi:hypothetical protein
MPRRSCARHSQDLVALATFVRWCRIQVVYFIEMSMASSSASATARGLGQWEELMAGTALVYGRSMQRTRDYEKVAFTGTRAAAS